MGITLDGKTLFELPIYRVSEDTYYKDFGEYYEKRKISHNDPLIMPIKVKSNISKY